MTDLWSQTTSTDGSSVSFDSLYRAILQCFIIILSGYVAGRSGLIPSSQSAGIGNFVSKFCLPALLFKSMCELNFSEVNWTFLSGIMIAKAVLFVIIVLLTMIIKRPLNLGYAGIFGIFATQSNDFALGYPIVQALYGRSHPDFLKYIYLVAPISLVVLNPIGFILMEVHKRRTVRDQSQEGRAGVAAAVLHVVKGVLLNPIVFMTVIGVIGNFIFSSQVPGILNDILVVLGRAFDASALFYLGLSMVGKVRSQIGLGLVVPMLLITAKTLILPLITWEVVGWLETSDNNTDYSMFGFLYGTFPTAPSVFLYASDYGVAQNMIATGLVLGTFLSAPFMFVSAKMMTLIVDKGTDYKNLLLSTSFDVSIISIVCCVWVLGVFLMNGRWKRVPHKFTCALMFSQIVACTGMIAYYGTGETHDWKHYPVTILLLVGVFASRCWTAVIAVVLCLLHVRSLCFVLRMQVWFYFAGFGLPVLFTGILFLVGSHQLDQIDPSFHYGTLQTIFSLVILIVSLIVTVTSLVWWQRVERHLSHGPLYSSLSTGPESSDVMVTRQRSLLSDEDQGAVPIPRSVGVEIHAADESPALSKSLRSNHNTYGTGSDMKPREPVNIEDLIPYPGTDQGEISDLESSAGELLENISERTCLLGQCTSVQRHACMDRLRTYSATVLAGEDTPQEENIKTVHEMNRHEYQTAHHLIMLLLLILSMFIGMFLCFWKVFRSKPSGIYVEIEFLDSVFNYGQGFLILTVFGFDTRLVFSPLVRRLRRLIFGAEVLRLPKFEELDAVTKQTCQQFTDYHKENCVREIVRDRRFRFRNFKDVFTGAALCDWLVKAGLATDRDEAENYGKRLVLGRVLTHVNGEHNFHDAPYFYKFLDTFEYMAC